MPQLGPDNNFVIKFGAVTGGLVVALFILLMSSVLGPISVPHFATVATTPPPPPTATVTPAATPVPAASPAAQTSEQSLPDSSAIVLVVLLMALVFVGVFVASALFMRASLQETPTPPPPGIDEKAVRRQLESKLLQNAEYHRAKDAERAQREAQREERWQFQRAVNNLHASLHRGDAGGSAKNDTTPAPAPHDPAPAVVRNSRRYKSQGASGSSKDQSPEESNRKRKTTKTSGKRRL